MYKKITALLIGLSFLLTAANWPNTPSEPPVEEGEIEWLSFEEAVKRNQSDPRKVIIDVYTDWCGWCKVMDKNTFKNPVIAAYIKENYHAVKLDAEQKGDIEFDGHTFKYVAQGRRGYHELAASLMQGKMSYPTIIFLDEQMRMIQPIPGYQKPEQLDPILRYLGEDLHKKTPWEEYQKNYESPFN